MGWHASERTVTRGRDCYGPRAGKPKRQTPSLRFGWPTLPLQRWSTRSCRSIICIEGVSKTFPACGREQRAVRADAGRGPWRSPGLFHAKHHIKKQLDLQWLRRFLSVTNNVVGRKPGCEPCFSSSPKNWLWSNGGALLRDRPGALGRRARACGADLHVYEDCHRPEHPRGVGYRLSGDVVETGPSAQPGRAVRGLPPQQDQMSPTHPRPRWSSRRRNGRVPRRAREPRSALRAAEAAATFRRIGLPCRSR